MITKLEDMKELKSDADLNFRLPKELKQILKDKNLKGKWIKNLIIDEMLKEKNKE